MNSEALRAASVTQLFISIKPNTTQPGQEITNQVLMGISYGNKQSVDFVLQDQSN